MRLSNTRMRSCLTGGAAVLANVLAGVIASLTLAPASMATAIKVPEERAATIQSTSTETASDASYALNLVLSLSARRVAVYRGEMLVASYAVAVGREGWNTPTGEFNVFQKQTNPAWEHPFTGEVLPPGPDNPLGARWIGFWSDGTNSIGFHGTPDESVIGSAVSHGCVRMRNEDVLALYEQVGLDTPVTVLP
ncbi:MAG: L,D-transpeptidase family protein [Cyanobacteria bacterium P01_F01_bin.53]